MSGKASTEDTLSTLIRALMHMNETQRVHGEVLGKILDAVTRESGDGNRLADCLKHLVTSADRHTEMLQHILSEIRVKP